MISIFVIGECDLFCLRKCNNVHSFECERKIFLPELKTSFTNIKVCNLKIVLQKEILKSMTIICEAKGFYNCWVSHEFYLSHSMMCLKFSQTMKKITSISQAFQNHKHFTSISKSQSNHKHFKITSKKHFKITSILKSQAFQNHKHFKITSIFFISHKH